MAVYPDTLDPTRLSDFKATELWRRTVSVGEGQVILLGAYHTVDHPDKKRQLEASVTITCFCCPRNMPVSSVVIWNEYGEEALSKLQQLENTIVFNA